MNTDQVALRNQLGFCIQPMLYVAPQRGAFVHIGEVCLSWPPRLATAQNEFRFGLESIYGRYRQYSR